MPRATRLFRVFVSSTFSDFAAEREVLRERVFPRIRALCRARGATFQAVDLRWGVSRAAAENHETMRICLGEIDRCRAVTSRPNFIALLGDRYGWRPAPELVPEHEFLEIARSLQSRGDDADSDLFSRSYRRDSNAVPAAYRLDLDHFPARRRREVLGRLTELVRTAAVALPFTETQRRRYLASATEQEIAHRGLLDAGREDGAAFCVLRSIAGVPRDERGEGFIDLGPDGTPDHDAQARLGELKARLLAGGRAQVRSYEARWGRRGPSRRHLARVAADTYAFLAQAIDLELAADAGRLSDPTEVEIAAHASFAEDRRRVFTGRADALRAIRGYLDGPANAPFVVHGASGSGKSTVMARAIAEAPADASVVYRFIGAVPGSTLLPVLLDGLCQQLARLAGDDRPPTGGDVHELVQEFRRRVANTAARRGIVLFLDALDQLSPSHGARSLHWLPATMFEGVHLVVSTVNDDVLDALAGFVPASHRYELRPMTPEEGGSLLDLWLEEDDRTLQAPQRATVLDAFGASGLPLHLRLAAAEASTWPSYHPAVAVSPEVQGLLRALFSRLSDPAHHGAKLVARSVAYVAAGRSGVSEDELLDLLSADAQVMREFRARSPDSPQTRSLPDIVWSRLYFDLAPYLTQRGVEGTATLDFFHRQLRETVEHDQLTGSAKARRHLALARYFDAQPLTIAAKGAAAPNLRKLGELPFQFAYAGLWPDLEALLTSFAFLRAKLEGLGMLATVEDFDMARQAALGSGGARFRERRGPVQAVQDALRLSSGVLADQWDMLAPQLLARLRGQHRTLARMLRDAERQRAGPWLNPLVSSLAKPGGPLNQAIVLDSDIAAVSLAGDHDVLAGCSDGTLRLIDLDRGIEAWRLAAHAAAIVDVACDAPRQRAVTISADGSVAMWALETRSRQLAFSMSPVVPRCVRISADGAWVFIGGRQRISESPYEEGVGSIRDLSDGRERGRFARREGSLTTAALSPDGSTVVCGTSWGVFRLWDTATMAPIHEFRTHDGSVGSIAGAADGDTMLIGSGDQSSGQYNLRLWSRREWRELHVFKGHLWMIDSVALTPDARLGASGGSDGTVRVWNLDERRQIAYFPGHRGRFVRAVDISLRGDRVVSASASSLYDWSLDPSLIAQPFHVHDARVTTLAAAADGSRAISCAADGTVAIWNLRTLRAERTTALGSERIAAAALDRLGRSAVVVTRAGVVVRLDLRAGTVEKVLRAEASGGGAVLALSADGRLAAVAGNGTISVVDLRTGSTLGHCERHVGRMHEPITKLALSTDGTRIIATPDDFYIYTWNLATGSRVQRRRNLSSAPALAATPDGRRGVSGTQFGRMFVWELNPFRRRASLPHQEIGQNSEVSAVAIAPDGRRALSGGNDLAIRAWDLSSRRCLATFMAEDFTTCACAAGNDLFMAGSRNGAVHVLKVMPGATPRGASSR